MQLLARHFAGAANYAGHLRAALAPDVPSPTNPANQANASPSAASLLSLHRSVKSYVADMPVSEATVRRGLEAAVLAPNHFLTQPWRSYLLGPAARSAVLALNEKKAEEFGKVPGWLVVTIATEYDAEGRISTKKGKRRRKD